MNKNLSLEDKLFGLSIKLYRESEAFANISGDELIIKTNENEIKYSLKEIQNNKEVLLEVLQYIGSALLFAPEELRNDKEVVLAAVRKNGLALGYASEELCNDKEVILAAVQNHGNALLYASEELLNDKEIILEAVKQCGENIALASPELRNDKEVLAAVKQNNYNLERAYKKARNAIRKNIQTTQKQENG